MGTKIRPETLDGLARLERQMTAEGRTEDAALLREAQAVLARPEFGLITTGQAARRLGVAIQTVKNWIDRGTLKGVNTGRRWLVSEESVALIEGVRRTFAEMEQEGFPSTEEILELTKRTRRAAREQDVA